MTNFGRLSVVLLPVALGACAVVRPEGPSVLALPAQGRDLATFNAQEVNCRGYADAQIGPADAARGTDAAVGTAVVGTAIGAAAGALIGSASGNVGAGAAIGAGTGLAAGSVVGASGAQASSSELQGRYDAAYIQCITSSGNQVAFPQGPAYPYAYPYSYPYAVGPYAYYGAIAPYPFYFRFGGPRYYGPRYGYGRGGYGYARGGYGYARGGYGHYRGGGGRRR
ncbi:glycine zipper family protein [Plastoroseomonas arctica]|uniref:Glycine zipper family protein n=1 Tax=Plastoroseomonas arctica TaxID=1509237 RepID=A0AAF1JZ69_9PROT|nr:glycine zipper family protein [Plastoroseomonas arctica]MBR0654234.1 glycine zipper family protein [Plastoroseomonas arctica]